MSSPRPAGVTIKTLFLLNMQLPVAHNIGWEKRKELQEATDCLYTLNFSLNYWFIYLGVWTFHFM